MNFIIDIHTFEQNSQGGTPSETGCCLLILPDKF